jgi:hypothetical protein
MSDPAVASPRRIVPTVSGPRTIVPTAEFVPRGLAPVAGAPIPNLLNHGGPVIESVEVVPIYWGAAWATGTNATLATQLDGFFDFIVNSPYMDMLKEYGTASTAIRRGKRLASARVTSSEPGTVTPTGRQATDAQIQTALQGFIANQTVPATTANTLYFIFLPPNVVSMFGGTSSCVARGFCGYHGNIGNVFYAVIPFVDCSGCTFSGQFLDTLTEVSSHELAEAVTDPDGTGWWDPFTGPGDEIGDICNRQTTRLGGFLVQTEWSNARQACVAGPPPPPTFQRSPAAVSWAPDRLDFFGVGTNGHMFQRAWTGAAFGDWVDLGGSFQGSPAAVSWAPDRLDFFGVGTNGHMFQRAWTGAAFGDWVDLST